MTLLPALVLGAEIEGARVLQIRGQHDSLVAGLAWKLDPEVPGIEGNEDKVEVLAREVLVGEGVESSDSVSKGTRVSDMFPSQGSQTR